jgi:hypothetical protein
MFSSQCPYGPTHPPIHWVPGGGGNSAGAPTLPESESYITTDGQSASLSWNEAPAWGLRPYFFFFYCQTFAGLLMWGALSDERTGVSFTIAPGPRQRSHFRVRVPWDS